MTKPATLTLQICSSQSPIPVSGSSTPPNWSDPNLWIQPWLCFVILTTSPAANPAIPFSRQERPWWSQPWPEPTQVLLSALDGHGTVGQYLMIESHWWNNQWLWIRNHRNNVKSYHFLAIPLGPGLRIPCSESFISLLTLSVLASEDRLINGHREVNWLSQSHTANRQGSRNSNPMCPTETPEVPDKASCYGFHSGSKAEERDYEKEESIEKGRGFSYQISKHSRQLFVVVLNSRWNCALRVYLEMLGAFSIVTIGWGQGAVLPPLSTKDWIQDPKESVTSWVVKPQKNCPTPNAQFYSKSLLKKEWDTVISAELT